MNLIEIDSLCYQLAERTVFMIMFGNQEITFDESMSNKY